MSKSSRTSYEQRFWEMNDSKSWLDQKLGQKKRSICAIQSEDAIIKRRLLRKSQDMPGQRRRSLDRQMPVKEYMV